MEFAAAVDCNHIDILRLYHQHEVATTVHQFGTVDPLLFELLCLLGLNRPNVVVDPTSFVVDVVEHTVITV